VNYLETAQLVLREFTEQDVDNLVELDSDPAVMRYLNGGRATPREQIANDFLPNVLSCYATFPGLGRWAAERREKAGFLGWFSLIPRAGDPGDLELGYRLLRDAWSQGLGGEGASALVERAFDQLGANRVFATTMTVNTRSRRVMERAGLRFVRTFQLDWPEQIAGAEFGDVEYALEREDWKRNRGVR
jgi:RimJ/RimL family protein N-acetyltransferase